MTRTPADRSRRSFALEEAVSVLARTPGTLDAMLRGLGDGWITANEGENTWSAFDTFDRFAQFAESEGRPLDSLLDEFASLRRENLRALSDLRLTEADLDRRGRHPVFGAVTLRQLLATWMAHDLDHVVQISRVLARQYATEVGPWTAYLRIISGQQG